MTETAQAAPPFPTRVVIGNHSYECKLAPQHEVEDYGGDNAVGATHHPRGLIVVGDWLSPSQQRETMVHECLHVTFREGVPNAWGRGWLADEETDIEEFVVDAMDAHVFNLIHANPDLMAWLMHKEP